MKKHLLMVSYTVHMEVGTLRPSSASSPSLRSTVIISFKFSIRDSCREREAGRGRAGLSVTAEGYTHFEKKKNHILKVEQEEP